MRIAERQLFCLVALAMLAQLSVVLTAEEPPRIAAEGYITAMRPPSGFDVDGKHVTIQLSTDYRLIGNDTATSTVPYHGPLYAGEYVQVIGRVDRHTRSLVAAEIRQRADWDKKLTGLGVVTRLLVSGAEPVFEADGYRIRVTPAAAVSFIGPLKSLADVTPNVWIRYDGRRDESGDLVAERADFLPPKPTAFKAVNNLETFEFQYGAPKATKVEPIDSAGGASLEGGLVYLSQLGGEHRIPADHALQERIQRIGEALVPEYQKKLPLSDPSKIRFRFYAIDDDKTRTELCSLYGVILIPVQAVDRLGSEDHIAAVLADGIARDLQRQNARIVMDNRAVVAAEVAGSIPGAVLGPIMASKFNTEMEQERGRVALALIAAAGYDPWQAPEAWRLLAPKKLPTDLDELKYPDLSGYQLQILHFQYLNPNSHGASQADTAPPLASGRAAQK